MKLEPREPRVPQVSLEDQEPLEKLDPQDLLVLSAQLDPLDHQDQWELLLEQSVELQELPV